MQIITNFSSLIDRWLRYRFQTILAILGLALGYLLDPKSADSILSLSLILVPVACG
ncbi:hypothetical protein [Nostoc sp.]|uniref:hypothetical protein n=1 Tax=Nostoc sp. TaxID=1180 RepID=UPI002FF4F846